MKKKFGNFVHDNEDSVEFYSSSDILSARTLNRPLLKIFDTEEALTKYLEATVKTLYNKKGNFILPGYLEEFSSFTTGVINGRNYLRIPTGALVINEKLVFIKPNCESFERELAKAYGLNLNDFDNNITVKYECSNKQLNYKIKTTYVNFEDNYSETLPNCANVFEVINKFDKAYWYNNVEPVKQSLELLIDITDLEDGVYNLCYNNKFELSKDVENKIAEITFENKEIVNCNILISVADLNEIEFYNLKVENDDYSFSINENGLNITTNITNINSPVNITGDTTLGSLTAGDTTLNDLITSDTTLGNLTVKNDTVLNDLTASGTTLGSLIAGDTELNSLTAGDVILNDLTAGNTTLNDLTVNNLETNNLLDNLTVNNDTELNSLTVNNITTLNSLTAGDTELSSLKVENNTELNSLMVNAQNVALDNLTAGDAELDSLKVNNNTELNSLMVNAQNVALDNLTAGDATLDSLTVNAEVVTLNSLKVDKILPKTENLTINVTADRAIADANGNDIDTTYLKKGEVYDYTYIVDSDQKLADWANNVAGNDYTKVLIKSGTWSCSKTIRANDVFINLTNTGTKVIVGEPDNLLKFTGSNISSNNITNNYGLYYDSIPNSLDYYMTGVNVEHNADNKRISTYRFYNCTNLTNCTSSGGVYNGSGGVGFCKCTNLTNCSGSGTYGSYGFSNCDNLTNCSGRGGSTSSSSSCGFFNCDNLTNCTGSGVGTSGYGFYYCDNLTNCTGSANANHGFYNCKNLTNCSGNGDNGSGFIVCTNLTNCSGTGTGASVGYGFNQCTNLTNCSGTGTGASVGYGFIQCTNLTNCSGTGAGASVGYGFYYCNGVLKCKAGGSCTDSVFTNCYSTLQEDSSYAVANTPIGGFNDTTNPA